MLFRSCRIVLVEHEGETFVEEPEHVTHMTAVFAWRPDVGPWSCSRAWKSEDDLPLRGEITSHHADVAHGDVLSIKCAIRTGSLEHPRPVLRVGDDIHRAYDTESWASASASLRLPAGCTVSPACFDGFAFSAPLAGTIARVNPSRAASASRQIGRAHV